jgi:hypothetical protein
MNGSPVVRVRIYHSRIKRSGDAKTRRIVSLGSEIEAARRGTQTVRRMAPGAASRCMMRQTLGRRFRGHGATIQHRGTAMGHGHRRYDDSCDLDHLRRSGHVR